MIVAGAIIVFWLGAVMLVLAIVRAGRDVAEHWNDAYPHDERRVAAELRPVSGDMQAASRNGCVRREVQR